MNKNVLIGAVVILAVIGGGWYYLQNQKVQKLYPTTPEVVPTEAVKKDEVAMEKNSVEIKDFAFNPKTLTIKAGTTVKFTNKDVPGHSATADDKSFDTGVLSQGKSETVTFGKAGTYAYHCTPHPNIKATIVVE